MQLLVQWLCGPNTSPADVKAAIIAHLQQPGIGVAKTFYEEVCQCAKRFLGSRGERAEGLALLDLILDHIPESVLSQDIVYLMKQLITLSANDSFQLSCFTLLHRLILRLRTMTYIQRDMNTDVFPHLAQMLTRRLAVVPASPSLLALTRATFSHFSKACLSNRDQFERFLFKQLVAAERHDLKSGLAVVQTLAALPRCYVDPAMRHDVSTKHLDMLIRSCLLTEQAFLVAGAGHCDPSQLQNTIYAIADEPLFPANLSNASGHGDLRMVIWKRLLLQLDAVEAILASPCAKDIQHKLLLALINQMVMCAHTDEHLQFLRPTLIYRAIRIARQLVSGVRTHKMILVNARLADFFLHVLEVAHQNDPVDMTLLRADVYEVVAVWIRNMSPSSLMHRGEALLRIVSMASKDVAAGCDPDSVVTRGAEQRCAAALALQRAIVLAYGDRDLNIVRQVLLKLIPATVRLTRPLAGALLTCSLCRRRLYDLLAAFVIAPNPGLMPPTAEIRDIVREGLSDDVYEIRDTCDLHYRVICNALQPLECGFSLSYSHAMHEHNKQIRRLELTRSERTRSAEVQTEDGTLEAPVMADKGVSASIALPLIDDDEDDDEADEEDDLSDVEQIGSQTISRSHRRAAFPYQARAQLLHRPGPRCSKERRAVTALCDLEDAATGEAIQLDESPSEDEEEMMDEEELDDEQMEIDAQTASSFRSGRLQEETLVTGGEAVIITDDDDAVAITTPQPTAETGTVGAHSSVDISGGLENDIAEEHEDGDVDDVDDEAEREVEDEEDMGGDEVCVIEDEEENRQQNQQAVKANAVTGPNRKEVALTDDVLPQSTTTTSVKGNAASGAEQAVAAIEALATRSEDEKGVLGNTNGSDAEKAASPKVNGDSQGAGDFSKSSDVGVAKKSSPDEIEEPVNDVELNATIIPIGPEDSDEGEEANEAEPSLTAKTPSSSIEQKHIAATSMKTSDAEVVESTAVITAEPDETMARVIIQD